MCGAKPGRRRSRTCVRGSGRKKQEPGTTRGHLDGRVLTLGRARHRRSRGSAAASLTPATTGAATSA